MLKKIAIGLLLALGVLAAHAASSPAEYLVYKEISVHAAPKKIFPLINNSQEMGRWMPWAEMDPQMKVSYSGPDSGVGSKASWDSSGKMGAGSSTISESIQNVSVKYDLEYTNPFRMKMVAEISIKPLSGEKIVRWSVSGKHEFLDLSIRQLGFLLQ